MSTISPLSIEGELGYESYAVRAPTTRRSATFVQGSIICSSAVVQDFIIPFKLLLRRNTDAALA
jgi:hypothetical protein